MKLIRGPELLIQFHFDESRTKGGKCSDARARISNISRRLYK